MFRISNFDKLLDKATSNLKLEPDWPAILQICDSIRQGDVSPKVALAAIKKKLEHSNPHVIMFSLLVLESCVKNCGSLIHDEIGTKAYMEQLRETIKNTHHDDVKTKLLELIQAWAYAFRNIPKYRAVQDTVNIMKAEGYTFPPLKESDAMFSADTAPEWADGDRCHRCRVQFGILVRKHHCRACGQVFCGQCTSKTCTLPKFGIEKEVRVCEACYDKVCKPSSNSKSEELPVEYLKSSLAQQSQAPPPRKSDAELKEEEDLQLALALSQSEAEVKKSRPTMTTSKSYSPPAKLASSPEADPELARYLNRSFWQQHSFDFNNSPSAPSAQPQQQQQQQQQKSMNLITNQYPTQNGVEESEMEEFVTALRSQVEIFVNRMNSNSSRGRSIANDSSVQTLFMNITAMHSKLLKYIQQQDDSRVYFEGLQDKLSQVKDARAALDALREEHREKLRRQAELAERQRQMQMAQKLDIMRKKKQEYLQYQRQLALQRIQEQEREMQLRQEQQKQQYIMGSAYSSTGLPPYMSGGGPPPTGAYDYGAPRGIGQQPGPPPPGAVTALPRYPPFGPGPQYPPDNLMPHLGPHMQPPPPGPHQHLPPPHVMMNNHHDHPIRGPPVMPGGGLPPPPPQQQQPLPNGIPHAPPPATPPPTSHSFPGQHMIPGGSGSGGGGGGSGSGSMMPPNPPGSQQQQQQPPTQPMGGLPMHMMPPQQQPSQQPPPPPPTQMIGSPPPNQMMAQQLPQPPPQFSQQMPLPQQPLPQQLPTELPPQQLNNQQQPQQIVKEEEKTAELISFD